jgi:hypothetical protein
MVLPLMPVERDWRLYNMGQCMVECFTMTSCMFTNIQTTCRDRMNCDVATCQKIVTRHRQAGTCQQRGIFWWLQSFG